MLSDVLVEHAMIYTMSIPSAILSHNDIDSQSLIIAQQCSCAINTGFELSRIAHVKQA